MLAIVFKAVLRNVKSVVERLHVAVMDYDLSAAILVSEVLTEILTSGLEEAEQLLTLHLNTQVEVNEKERERTTELK